MRDVTDRSIEYIRERAKEKAPFFLYLALAAPHTPVMPTKAFQGRTGIGAYGDFVAETDAAVGKILRALETTGLAPSTLIMASAALVEVELVCSDAGEHRRRVESRVSHIRGHRLPTWQDVLARAYLRWDREHVTVETAGRTVEQVVADILAAVRS